MENPLYVEAAGEIPNPGVYRFSKMPITAESLLERSGGDPLVWFGKDSYKELTLQPGDRVVFQIVGGKPHILMRSMDAYSKMTLGLKIPINRSSAEELTALPGIGPALAADIAEQRDRMGGFNNEAELLLVHGIGQETLKRVRPHLHFQ
jgi:competence ComEA-like helix-hairpin-helix protein